MDFSLSAEHQMTQKMVRDFGQKEIAPVIKEHDRKQEPIPFALKRMGELGILGLPFPTRYGGAGMDYIAWGLACEELEAVDTSLRVVMSVHTGLCAMTVFQWGTEEQKQRFLVPLASGKKSVARPTARSAECTFAGFFIRRKPRSVAGRWVVERVRSMGESGC